MDQPFYILSNACQDIFPNNTLSEFKNVFPKTLSFSENDKWEVGLEAIGLSSMFRNIYLPKPNIPSIYVCHEQMKKPSFRENTEEDGVFDWHKSMMFNFDKRNGMGTWFEMADKFYTQADIYSLCTLINVRTKAFCLFRYDGEKITITYHDEYNLNYIGTWVFLHETFVKTFHFNHYEIKDLNVRPDESGNANSKIVKLIEIGSNLYIQRIVNYNGEKYYGYFITKDNTITYHSPLVSEKFNINQNQQLPEVIKIQCDIIEPQILNNSYSQDLIVLNADIHYTNRYFFHEIEKISYIPILFNDISQIKITLVDEHNKLLDLVSGHATIVKLKFKQNKNMSGNFYCRVTSKPNDIYPENKINNFSVQLPSAKYVDDDWKVSLNSINLPNTFTTFLPNRSQALLSLTYATPDQPSIKFYFKSNKSYTPAKIASELNAFFMENNIGRTTIDKLGRLVFYLNRKGCNFALGMDVAHVLGYQTGQILPADPTYMYIRPFSNEPKVITFESPIDCNYFRPNYFIIYSNIVQPSIIGNQMSPILKVVPVIDNNEPYKLIDFKVREFYNIPNSEITEIKMELRTHDGELVNFLEDGHVVMNLQFTNSTKNA